MTTSLTPDARCDGTVANLGPCLRRLYEASVCYSATRASQAVDRLTRRLEAVAQPHGAADRAALEGAKATILGGNPVWAAVKGAWKGADVKVKAAVVTLLLLTLVVSPVLLVLLLLGLLVAGAVAAVRGVRAGA